MPTTTDDDRLLEETFRPVLAAALGAGIGLALSHDGEPTGQPRALPMVILSARHLGDDWSLTGDDGRPMAEKELRAECRVDGTLPNSAATIENLAADVRTALLATTADDCADWEMIERFDHTGTERGIDGSTRTHTLIFTCLTLRI